MNPPEIRDAADVAAVLAKYTTEENVPITTEKPATGEVLDVAQVQLTGQGQLSDAAVSEQFADTLRARHCWADGLGWMRYDGKKWSPCPAEFVVEASRKFAKDLVVKAIRDGADPEKVKTIISRLTARAVKATVELARGIVMVNASDFDAHPDLLNVGNGVVDLTTGTLAPHNPALLLTKGTAVDYLPDAAHADWPAALEALPPEVADYMQIRFGQAASGHPTPDDVLPVMQGGGANGKSTIFVGTQRALGDYAITVPERVLLANPSDHPTELMTLRGARLAIIEETPEARHLNVKRLKDVLGTDPMSARHIMQNSVSWSPSHSLFLATNYPPRVDETDHGTWRRLALIRFPFTYRQPGEPITGKLDKQGDPTLRERIKVGKAQHQAVLAWIVEGARRWYAADRIMPPKPAAVVTDTREWRKTADLVLSYYDERLQADPARHIATTDMFADFTAWHQSRGGKSWGDQTFTTRFGGHEDVQMSGIEKDRIYASAGGVDRPAGGFHDTLPKRYQAWHGVRFKTDDDDKSDENSDKTPDGLRGKGHFDPSLVPPHVERLEVPLPPLPVEPEIPQQSPPAVTWRVSGEPVS